MTTSADYLADARLVADAILYEGYLLYPYRSSAGKNQSRFQFGVLMPAGYRAVDDCEPSASQTECLLECPVDAEVTVAVRFLHLQRRAAEEADGAGGFRPVASLRAGQHRPAGGVDTGGGLRRGPLRRVGQRQESAAGHVDQRVGGDQRQPQPVRPVPQRAVGLGVVLDHQPQPQPAVGPGQRLGRQPDQPRQRRLPPDQPAQQLPAITGEQLGRLAAGHLEPGVHAACQQRGDRDRQLPLALGRLIPGGDY